MTRPQPQGPVGMYLPTGQTPEELVELALADGRRLNHRIAPERAVVNCLRHEFTTYDQAPSQTNHFKVCRAIAGLYPHLAEECARQVRARSRKEGGGKATDPAATIWFIDGSTLVLATTDPILGIAQMGDTILDVTYGIHLEES